MFKKDILKNLKSGIVVFLVALPLCLGIALASGMPAASGVLSGVIAGVFVTLLSNSTLSVSGPAAGLTSIVVASLASLGDIQTFAAAVIFAGVLQLIFGFLKFGSIVTFIPDAVIKGMLAGIGIILIIKQLPHLVGYDKDPEGDEEFFQSDGYNSFSEIFNMFSYVKEGALIIGLLSLILVFFGASKFYKNLNGLKNIPIQLIVVVLGLLLCFIFNNSSASNFQIEASHRVNLPEFLNIGDFIASFTIPSFTKINTGAFWIVVATVSLVASIESLLSLSAVDSIDPQGRTSSTNQELLAQGIGNILCGLIGALPVTSVIVRSAANVNAGGTTKLSAIVHALLLLLSLLFLSSKLNLIPNACLAAILIYTGYKLASPRLIKEIYKQGVAFFFPFLATVIVMLLTDLLKGVFAGIIISYLVEYFVYSKNKLVIEQKDGKKIIHLPAKETVFLYIKLKKQVRTKTEISIKYNDDAKYSNKLTQLVLKNGNS